MSEVSKKKIVSNGSESNGAQLTSDLTVVLTDQATEDDVSLQDLIEAELNSRLSNITDDKAKDSDDPCMALSTQGQPTKCVEIEGSLEQLTTKENQCDKSDENVKNQIRSNANNITASLKIKGDTEKFIKNEKEFSEMSNMKSDSPINVENSVYHLTVKISEENNIVKEPSFTQSSEDTMDCVNNVESTVKQDKPSIKDKLMLGNDEHLLLFSQTITSPAFTPTEDFDIVQAIIREENSIDEFVKIESMCLKESFDNHEENSEGINNESLDLNKTPTVENNTSDTSNGDVIQEFSPETVNNSTAEHELINEGNEVDEVPEQIEQLSQDKQHSADVDDIYKSQNSLNETNEQIEAIKDTASENDFSKSPESVENGDENGVDDFDDLNHYKLSDNTFLINDKKAHDPVIDSNNAKLVLNLVNITSTVETSVTQTIENNSNTMNIDNKAQVKKKKSKKSKKEHEKENISVNDNDSRKMQTYIEDDLSQVNVKNLCRSFGDLTSLPDENSVSSQNTPVSPKSLPDSRAKSMVDLRRLDSEPLYTGVSVKALRASYMNLATNTNSNFPVCDDLKRKSRPLSAHPPLLRTSSLVGQTDAKSSFSKFDALAKKTVLHVRSSDAGKAQEKFNGSSSQTEHSCKSCGKQVFQMEQIKAEKSIWHKNCFRCNECKKQLNVDTYQSHEGTVYCKPHFKALFAPKVVEDTQPTKPRKHEMIIRESQPIELPPDVVRASDKPDLGLEELQSLNVKSRFQVFEHANDQSENSLERTPSNVNVKRSPSILSKLARFQAKGMDIGVTDDSLNGIPVEDSSEESESDDGIEGEDADLIRAQRKSAQKEQPVVFDKLNDLKSKWESGGQLTKEERREERKQEIQSIRSRLFMGKQGKMKEMYQQAVAESESGANVKKQIATEVSDQAKSLKERFEKGDIIDNSIKNSAKDEDMSVFEAGISKKSRSLFLELDANAGKAPQMIPLTPVKSTSDVKKVRETFIRQDSEDLVRSSDAVDDVHIETADISSKFKFFETYKAPEVGRKQFRITPPRDGVVKDTSPDREIYRDPDVVRAEELIEDPTVAAKTHTATKMLSIFRQLEEQSANEPVPSGLKPLKRFTPPPESQRAESDSEGEDVTDEDEDGTESESDHRDIVRAADKQTDEFLIQAQNAARAKQLRAKFERWEENEIQREQREQNASSVNLSQEGTDEQIESAKTLRARFESMRETSQQAEKQPRIKVHRFVELQRSNAEICGICTKRVYPLEKVECDNKIYHKQCFRCLQCNAVLRMETYTLNQGMLYCIPHFKQLFIAKGNYETGFGLDQHKSKWEQQHNNGPQSAASH